MSSFRIARLAAAAAWPFLLLIAAAAQAAVEYRFEGRAGSGADAVAQSFTARLDDYVVTGEVALPAAALTDCSVEALSCTGVVLHAVDPFNGDWSMVTLQTEYVETYYYFALGSLRTPGLHPSTGTLINTGQLWVAGPPVPEPAAWALLASGLAVLAWRTRRQSPGRTA